MYLFACIAIFFSAPAFAEDLRKIQISPLSVSFPFGRQAGQEASNLSCMISMSHPEEAFVMKETKDEFYVWWDNEPQGCFMQKVMSLGQGLKRGWVKKKDIIWEEGGKNKIQEIPMIPYPELPATAARPADCLELGTQKFIPEPVKQMDIGGLISFMRNEAGGIKPPEKIDLYQRCYPFNKQGAANYQKYKKFMPMAGETFRMTERREPQEVNPGLLSCLLRRESGFDEHNSGATGIGQHTSVNIKEISSRLRKPGSWEAALWKKYFDKVKADPEGRAALASCMGSSKTGEPVFDTKEDALCPLQSMAAASIYILMIQRELSRTSKIYSVQWENELEYQLAIAAAYNLGEGAAGAAVKNLLVGDWVSAIRKKSAGAAVGKDCEVMLHIEAVRNCLQAKEPWKPMYYAEKPVCEELRGVKIEQRAKPSCVAWSAVPKGTFKPRTREEAERMNPRSKANAAKPLSLPKQLPANTKKLPKK